MSMSVNPAEHYARYRVPTEDGQILCLPQWQNLNSQLNSNREQIADESHSLFGRSLRSTVARARDEIVQSAYQYTCSYAKVDAPKSTQAPIIATGHQPDLVHPGVWLKNFATARLAKQFDAIAINLVIDNDLCRLPSIRVPTGTVDQPRTEAIAYDQNADELPFEQRQILDKQLWNSFPNRAAKLLSSFINNPILNHWWPTRGAQEYSANLGETLAQARHLLELQWDSKSYEIPQSRVCQTKTFRWFVTQLITEAAPLRNAFNSALAEYRQVHRLRNHAQPLPDLSAEDDWLETPFWVWSNRDPQRRALFAKPRKSEILLTDRAGFHDSLPRDTTGECSAAIEQLVEWEKSGIKIRTRALTTTMFARLFLADLFIHGIGGAKYDQVTDQICLRLFGWKPPVFATISGTLRLPVQHPPSSRESQVEIQRRLREIQYHPEVEIFNIPFKRQQLTEVRQLCKQKQDWIHTQKTPQNAAERHEKITSVNTALQPWLDSLRTQLESQLVATDQRIRANRLIESREYPFCLFPQETLRNFFLDFSHRMP